MFVTEWFEKAANVFMGLLFFLVAAMIRKLPLGIFSPIECFGIIACQNKYNFREQSKIRQCFSSQISARAYTNRFTQQRFLIWKWHIFLRERHFSHCRFKINPIILHISVNIVSEREKCSLERWIQLGINSLKLKSDILCSEMMSYQLQDIACARL